MLVFLILIAAEIVLGLILAALPALLRGGISSVVAGTLVARSSRSWSRSSTTGSRRLGAARSRAASAEALVQRIVSS